MWKYLHHTYKMPIFAANYDYQKQYCMKHYIHRSILSLLLLAAPLAVMASPSLVNEAPELDVAGVMAEEPGDMSLEVRGNILHIIGAQGATLEIYDVTGKRVVSSRIDSNDKRVTLSLGKGCYIVKVGKITRKIAIS